ncbi:MAG: hypothetical protein QME74_07560, partial [Candidatus Edwardsbacteria bacterium]|nr:hypothetical protein [Candidatus Edwardsbacteria bacterium]
GIDTLAFYLIGFPDETRRQIQATMQYALHLYRKMNVTPMLGRVFPSTGSVLYAVCKERGLLADSKHGERKVIVTEFFDEDYIVHRLRNFRRRLYVLQVLKELVRIRDVVALSLRPKVAFLYLCIAFRLTRRPRGNFSNIRKAYRRIRNVVGRKNGH